MKKWTERILESTRGRVIQLLRRGESTVNELASALSVTDNAVRAHLLSLERDGLVRQSGKRAGVRKPEVVYALSSDAEQLFPKAYHVLLNLLLNVLNDRLSAPETEEILRDVGKQLAVLSLGTGSKLEERIEHAVDVLNQLGGLAEVQVQDGEYSIQGYSCPLGSVAQEHPAICQLAEALLTELVGEPVFNTCDRSGKPKCSFEVKPGSSD